MDGEKSFLAIPYTITKVNNPEISIGRRIMNGDRPKEVNGASTYPYKAF